MSSLSGLSGAVQYELSSFPDTNGLLVITADKLSPFAIRRVFTVHTDAGELRGQHAHRECTQFLVCVSGAFRVTIDDGTSVEVVTLNNPLRGLLIPPFLWASEWSESDQSVLLVLCDREFDENEYIRDYDEFIGVVRARGNGS